MFKGSNVALITPFKDNNLDEENYIKLINFHLENNTNGLVPAGTTPPSLKCVVLFFVSCISPWSREMRF